MNPNTLLHKYKQHIASEIHGQTNQEEAESVKDMKNKLRFHVEQKELYEKQQTEIMKILDIPKNNQCFSAILSAVKELKESSLKMHEQTEIALYSNAQTILETSSIEDKLNQ